MTDEREEAGEQAPDSSGKDDVPAVIYWRWSEADRDLFRRVKETLKIKTNADVLRFALGAAERELARSSAGGGS